MQRILIAGAGQSGLQLALSLTEPQHATKYQVTVMSPRRPAEVRDGRIMSTQCMFHPALQTERDHGLNLWEAKAPQIGGIGVSVAGPDGSRPVDWFGRLENYAQSVDQRIKLSTWLELLEDRGVRVEYQDPSPAALDAVAAQYDLVIAATGRSGLATLFERDAERSYYDSPQRKLAVAYVHGAQPRPEHPDTPGVRMNMIPGVGELFVIPGWTASGPCEMPFFEIKPGGPLDRWDRPMDPREHWDTMLAAMREFVPWEYDRFNAAFLTDENATLAGAVTPVVRKAVAQLPSGRLVLGMADAVVTNDPITARGANNASAAANTYLRGILEHDGEFDSAWMARTFERYWSEIAFSTTWTNMMLQPPPEHVQALLGAAMLDQTLADKIARGFSQPSPETLGWFGDPETAMSMLPSQGS